jgi:hypothetical protein
MPPVMWRQHLINPCSKQDPANRWHPKARVLWSEGPRDLEQTLTASDAVTFDTRTAADDHAIRKLARPWIDQLASLLPATAEGHGSTPSGNKTYRAHVPPLRSKSGMLRASGRASGSR